MAIRIPTSDQSKIFLGSQEIGAVYVGANKVWPDAPLIDPNAFIMRISVSARQTVTIPFYNATGYNGTINWKDGTTSVITSYNDTRRTHTYAAAGDYDIEFSGTFKGFYFNSSGDKGIVKRIIQWGNIGMTSTTSAFMGCTNLSDLGDFENYSSVTSLGTSCFNNCTSLTSVTIPSSVTSLGNSCFNSCSSLTSVTIPSSVTSLGYSCFYSCKSLTSVTIPSSVTSLGTTCFSDCTHMLSYYVNPTTPPTSGSEALSGATGWKIYVPSASVTAYKTASKWSTYASQIFAQ